MCLWCTCPDRYSLVWTFTNTEVGSQALSATQEVGNPESTGRFCLANVRNDYVMSKSHGSIHTKQKLKSLRRWSITLAGKWNSSSVRKQLDPYHVKLNLVSLNRWMNGRGEWRATEKLMTRNYVIVIWRRNSEDIL